MKLEEILGENSIAATGHARDESFILALSYAVYKADWKVIGSISIDATTYQIIKHKTEDIYSLGKVNTQNGKKVFDTVFRIELTPVSSFLNYNNIYQVNMVATHMRKRGLGIAKTMYRFLIKNLNLTILGDTYQYFGARKLWTSLSKDTDIMVDIIDLTNNNVVEYNVELYHGDYDHQIDERIWAFNNKKENIRLILVNI